MQELKNWIQAQLLNPHINKNAIETILTLSDQFGINEKAYLPPSAPSLPLPGAIPKITLETGPSLLSASIHDVLKNNPEYQSLIQTRLDGYKEHDNLAKTLNYIPVGVIHKGYVVKHTELGNLFMVNLNILDIDNCVEVLEELHLPLMGQSMIIGDKLWNRTLTFNEFKANDEVEILRTFESKLADTNVDEPSGFNFMVNGNFHQFIAAYHKGRFHISKFFQEDHDVCAEYLNEAGLPIPECAIEMGEYIWIMTKNGFLHLCKNKPVSTSIFDVTYTSYNGFLYKTEKVYSKSRLISVHENSSKVSSELHKIYAKEPDTKFMIQQSVKFISTEVKQPLIMNVEGYHWIVDTQQIMCCGEFFKGVKFDEKLRNDTRFKVDRDGVQVSWVIARCDSDTMNFKFNDKFDKYIKNASIEDCVDVLEKLQMPDRGCVYGVNDRLWYRQLYGEYTTALLLLSPSVKDGEDTYGYTKATIENQTHKVIRMYIGGVLTIPIELQELSRSHECLLYMKRCGIVPKVDQCLYVGDYIWTSDYSGFLFMVMQEGVDSDNIRSMDFTHKIHDKFHKLLKIYRDDKIHVDYTLDMTKTLCYGVICPEKSTKKKWFDSLKYKNLQNGWHLYYFEFKPIYGCPIPVYDFGPCPIKNGITYNPDKHNPSVDTMTSILKEFGENPVHFVM